jgi:hypothetical protein
VLDAADPLPERIFAVEPDPFIFKAIGSVMAGLSPLIENRTTKSVKVCGIAEKVMLPAPPAPTVTV